ncbi:uncharacterized protein [Aristolochia californica]|uniref:uncharacterized protein n=1 Tax=Aristolochia californica TaxID=171875 RepID=UPI0035D860E6
MYYLNNSNGSDRTIGSSSSSSGGNSNSPKCRSPNSLFITRRRYPLPSASAFLTPAFNACVKSPPSLDILGVDQAHLRFSHDRFASAAESGPIRDFRRVPSLASISSPLSPIENRVTPPSRSPPMYKLSVETSEEDVLVMDGILVDGPIGAARSRPSPSELSSFSLKNHTSYKTEVCRSWEDLGTCPYDSKCLFAHGKEELRSTRQNKFKAEESAKLDSRSLPSVGLRNANASSETTSMPSQSLTLRLLKKSDEAKKRRSTPVIKSDENQLNKLIEKVESRTAAQHFVQKLDPEEIALSVDHPFVEELFKLYGPSRRRRLPVFEEICPE